MIKIFSCLNTRCLRTCCEVVKSREDFNDKYFWVCLHLFTPKYQISCWNYKLWCEQAKGFFILHIWLHKFMWTSNKWRKWVKQNEIRRQGERKRMAVTDDDDDVKSSSSHFNSKLILGSQVVELFEGSHLMTYLSLLSFPHHETSCDLSFHRHRHCLHSRFKLDLFYGNFYYTRTTFWCLAACAGANRNKNVETHRQVESARSLMDIHWC